MAGGSRIVPARRAVLAATIASVALAGLLTGRASAALHLRQLGSFDLPTYVASAPGARHLLFVVEQPGRIEVIRKGHKVGHPFLNIQRRVVSGGEQGLLSMAFDPGYRRNRRFYVYYTNRDCISNGACNVEVDSFRRSRRSRTRALPGSRHKVIEINHHQQPNHNGGQLEFHHGDLYLGVGDGGTQGDPENDAQNKGNLLGKILRIDPKAGGGYRVPRSNPFVGKPGRDEIFSIGLRNPWRFSFDRKTGDLWVGDVGWSSWEEIDRARLARANGGNFGWHIFEGKAVCGACGSNGVAPPHYIPPVHVYPHSGSGETGDVIVGGYVVRDRHLGSLRGRYIYTDDVAGDLRAFNPRTKRHTELGLSVESPSSFGEGPAGHIYVASLGGPVYRLLR